MYHFDFYKILFNVIKFVIATVKGYARWVVDNVTAASGGATEKDPLLTQVRCTAKATILLVFFGILIPVAVLVGIYLAIKHLLIWALVVFVIIVAILDEIRKMTEREAAERQFYIEDIRYLVCLEVFTALQELGSLLPVKPLNALTEINGEVIDRKDFLAVRISALKTVDASLTDDERQRIKAQLQAVLNNHFRAGLVVGAEYASFDGKTPLLYVEQVLNNGIYVTFDLIVADTVEAIAHIESTTAPKNHTEADGVDKDF